HQRPAPRHRLGRETEQVIPVGGAPTLIAVWAGIFPKVWKGATATFTGCTITGNTAHSGGGIYTTSVGSALTAPVTAPLTAATTATTVQTASYFAIGQTIQVGNEQITVTGVDTLRGTLRVIRGVNHTTAADHPSGAGVIGLSTCLDAFTLAHPIGNSAPNNA